MGFKTTLQSTALALVLIAGAAAQAPLTTLAPDAIMGFETPAGWSAGGQGFFSTTVSSTTTRTQGNFALAVKDGFLQTTLTSMPVASTAAALAGVGNNGAIFEVDILPPTQRDNDFDDRFLGSLQLFVSCPSRRLNNEFAGNADLAALRPGIYNTLKFPISDRIQDALGGAAFNDLTFKFVLSWQLNMGKTYLFDNLRVHSVTLVTAKAGTKPPAGYGGSVDLVAIGNTPVSQVFAVGPVQVPDSFHLKLGTAGATTVKLDLGYTPGTPAITCTYIGDSTDHTGKSYALTSCTGGAKAGDLVGAGWAQLTIVGGTPAMKIRAQLSKNPVGDQVGTGVIPAMPTWWGDFDSCVPAPVKGTVVTTSPSCTAQIAEANQIANAYFNKVNSPNVGPNWVVTPAPEFARRQGNGAPYNNLTGPPPPPGDPPIPFDQEGHLNAGGDWDAYWRLNGSLDGENVAGTDQTSTHFDATLGAHVVAFGDNVDVVDIMTTIDTATAESTPTILGPLSTGTAHLYLFGTEVPTGGFSTNLSTFNVDESLSKEFDLPPVQVWIFSITLGATADVGIKVTGGVLANGFNVVFTPNANMGAHVQGSVSIIIASGGVDAKVNLLSVGIPIGAKAQWSFNYDPAVCAATLGSSLSAAGTFGSLGGEIDLVASYGICPFCHDSSWTLFQWAPLATYTANLISTPFSNTNYKLPPSVCTNPLKVSIFVPTSGQSFPAGVPIELSGLAQQYNLSSVPCSALHWTFTPNVASDTVSASSTTGCNPLLTFGQPTSGTTANWTIGLSASNSFVNQFETITEIGSATPVPIAITQSTSGVNITELTDSTGTVYIPSVSGCLSFAFCLLGNSPMTYTIQGLVAGGSGTLNTVFTVTDSMGNVTSLTTTNPASSTPSASWTPPVINFYGTGINSGQYTITMTTTVNGSAFASKTATVYFSILE